MLLRAADVAGLAAFVASAQQHHDLSAVKSVVNTESRAEIYPQLGHSAAHGLGVAEIPSTHAGQPGIHRRLHSFVAERIEPFVKRDESVLKLQLLDFPLDHRGSVMYR